MEKLSATQSPYKMGENGSTVATYVFRGIEYVVTVTVEDGRSLLVEVEDRMTADQWCGSFDVDCKY